MKKEKLSGGQERGVMRERFGVDHHDAKKARRPTQKTFRAHAMPARLFFASAVSLRQTCVYPWPPRFVGVGVGGLRSAWWPLAFPRGGSVT